MYIIASLRIDSWYYTASQICFRISFMQLTEHHSLDFESYLILASRIGTIPGDIVDIAVS
jgi:hypothetical protein